MSMEIYFSEISEVENIETMDLMSLIPKAKQEKLRNYHFPIDRKLGLYAELLVRWRAISQLGLSNSEIEFTINENGKPFLKYYPTFYFNISHTRNAVVVAFSRCNVGVDIEKIKSADFQISKRFLTSTEQDYILSHKNPECAFYEIWTKKEAYVKCLGTGLATPLKSFNVLNKKDNHMINTSKIRNYLVSTCCMENVSPHQTIKIVPEAELQILIRKVVK